MSGQSRSLTGAVFVVLLGGTLLFWIGPRPVAEIWVAQEPPAEANLPRVRTHSWAEVSATGEPLGLLLPEEAHAGLFFDADNDGDLDVVVRATESSKPTHVRVFLRLDSGFREMANRLAPALSVPRTFDEIACGDFDADGRIDMVLLASGTPTVILSNRFHQQPFLLLYLTPRDADLEQPAGVLTVVIACSDREIVRRVHANAMDIERKIDLPVHIGLGNNAPTPIATTVTWPDGETASFAALTPGATYRIVQGETKPRRLSRPAAQPAK